MQVAGGDQINERARKSSGGQTPYSQIQTPSAFFPIPLKTMQSQSCVFPQAAEREPFFRYRSLKARRGLLLSVH